MQNRGSKEGQDNGKKSMSYLEEVIRFGPSKVVEMK